MNQNNGMNQVHDIIWDMQDSSDVGENENAEHPSSSSGQAPNTECTEIHKVHNVFLARGDEFAFATIAFPWRPLREKKDR